MTQIPAGWYPDPAAQQSGQYPPGQPPLRYWDGQAWTEHVQAAPLPAPPMPAPPTQYAGQYAGQYVGQQAGQYAGQQGALGPTTPDGVPLAGWWRRVGAFVLDSILISILTSIVTVPLQVALQDEVTTLMRDFEQQTTAGAAPDFGSLFADYWEIMQPLILWSALASFVAWAIYSSLMLRFKRATLGKMALGLEVRLRDQPGQMPWSTIFSRLLVQFGVYLAAVLPALYFALSWFPLLDSLWPLWDKKRQALHDKAAKTNVVRVR